MQNTIVNKEFLKNILFSYGTQLAAIALGFLFVTIITRYSGLEVYGKVAILVSLGGLVSNVLTFRTNEAVVKFYKVGLVEGNNALCASALVFGFIIDLVAGTFCVSLIYVFSDLVASGLLKQPDADELVKIYAWIVFLGFLRGSSFGLLMAEERFALMNIISVVEQAIKVFLLICLLASTYELDFACIVWVMLLASLSVSCAMVVYFFAKLRLIFSFNMEVMAYIRSYVSFSGSTFLSSFLKAGNQNVDTMMFGAFAGPMSAGIYGILKQFLSPIVMIGGPFSAQVYPHFVKAVSERNINLIISTIRKVNRMLLLAACVLLLLCSLLLVGYVEWNHLEIKSQHYVAFALLALALLINQQMWWARPFSLSLMPRASVVGNFLATLLLVLTLPVLISRFDVVGGAVSILITQLTIFFYWRTRLLAVFPHHISQKD